MDIIVKQQDDKNSTKTVTRILDTKWVNYKYKPLAFLTLN